MAAINQTVAPTEEPVTLAEAKSWLKVTHTTDDAIITDLIVQARSYAEQYCECQLLTATWEYTLDAFPLGNGSLIIPRPPLQSVSSVQYLDKDGNTQTLAASEYSVDIKSKPGWIAPAKDKQWPVTQRGMNAVTITYLAGWTLAALIPAQIRLGLLNYIALYYDARTGCFDQSALDRVNDLFAQIFHGDISLMR